MTAEKIAELVLAQLTPEITKRLEPLSTDLAAVLDKLEEQSAEIASQSERIEKLEELLVMIYRSNEQPTALKPAEVLEALEKDPQSEFMVIRYASFGSTKVKPGDRISPATHNVRQLASAGVAMIKAA